MQWIDQLFLNYLAGEAFDSKTFSSLILGGLLSLRLLVVVFLEDLSEDFSEDFVDFRCFLSGLESSDLCLLDFFRCLDLDSFTVIQN